MLKTLAAVAVVAAAYQIMPVAAQEKQYNQIGPWKIIAIYNKGRLHRCAAHLQSKSGILRIAHFPGGNWNFSVPCFAQNTKGAVEVHLGRELGRLRMQTDVRNCRTVTDALGRDWTSQLRKGGTLTLVLGKERPNWNLANVGNAMASVEACVRAAAAPAPAGAPAVAAPKGAPQPDPLATVRYVYAPRKTARTEPFSKRLMALHDAAGATSARLNEPVTGLNFDYAISAQDEEPETAASVRYQVLTQDARRASVKVTFRNGGPRELRYDLVFENGRWLIDEVRRVGTDAWVLSDLLRRGAQGK